MKSKNKIEIRCRKCGKLDMEIEVEGSADVFFHGTHDVGMAAAGVL